MDDNSLTPFLERIAISLEDIAAHLARAGAPQEPNYVKPLSEYRGFDWSAIEAAVVQQDADGPTHLEWGGFLWTRRSPANKFDPAIWYSRAHGRDAEGNVSYLRLITFKPFKEADRVPEKTAAQLSPQQAPAPTPPGPAFVDPARTESGVDPARISGGMDPANNFGGVDRASFLQTAIQEYNIFAQAADRIAAIAGVKLPNADHTLALAYLPFFGRAKKLGLDFAAARAILEEKVMDLDAAMEVLEKQHTPPVNK